MVTAPTKPATATLSAKGWVVIPKEIRDSLGLKKGDRLRVIERNGEIILRRAPKDPVAAGWGMLKGGMSMAEFLEEKKRELEEEERGLPPPRPRS
jgi:AbrB family looped-hinge helix DNA binding protein